MVDYSKWKNIEISDDEDETHPNIDTPSLFRWRHQARIERMAEAEKEQRDFESADNENKFKMKELRAQLEEAEKAGKTGTDLAPLQERMRKLEREHEKLRQKEEQLKKKDKTTPWNVDTISKSGFTKTVINKKEERPSDGQLTDEQREENMKKFIKENEKVLKKFGMLRRYDDSKQFLNDNPQLVCEETANYLVIWCINLEMEEKHELMAHVAHQTICMQYILEMSKQLDIHPRGCVSSFFSRIQVAEASYKDSFEDELGQFKERIRKRAKQKIEEALKEQEEEERQARLGPGGLDPQEVFDELPEALQKCFNDRDIQMLQETIAKMPKEEAAYHMKRCVDSGLWVPDAAAQKEGKDGDAPETQNAD